jgi:hypothetical protein
MFFGTKQLLKYNKSNVVQRMRLVVYNELYWSSFSPGMGTLETQQQK